MQLVDVCLLCLFFYSANHLKRDRPALHLDHRHLQHLLRAVEVKEKERQMDESRRRCARLNTPAHPLMSLSDVLLIIECDILLS